MACLSGRRLSELLEEQQEPFLLDVHLLEKGCPSSRLLDADASAVLRRLTSKKNRASSSSRGGKQKTPAGVLKLLLSKILRTTAACSRRPPALQCSDSFKSAAVAPAPAPLPVRTTGGVSETGCSDSGSCSDSESSYDEKQRSPVSVLDHPFESSPVHVKLSPISSKLSSPSRTAAIDAFRELLDAAYSPALLTQLLAKSDDLAAKDTAAAYDDDEYCYGYHRARPKNGGGRYDDAAYWETHRAELARVSALVAAEVPCARLDAAAALQLEREDVGAGVADVVLHALLQELVVDLC